MWGTARYMVLVSGRHYHDLYSYGACGMAHEIFLEDRDTTRRVRPLSGHPIVPRSLCPVQPLSISPGRRERCFSTKNLPLHYREISNSRASRDLIGRQDPIGKLSIEIESMSRGTGHAAAMELQRCCSRSSHGWKRKRLRCSWCYHGSV